MAGWKRREGKEDEDDEEDQAEKIQLGEVAGQGGKQEYYKNDSLFVPYQNGREGQALSGGHATAGSASFAASSIASSQGQYPDRHQTSALSQTGSTAPLFPGLQGDVSTNGHAQDPASVNYPYLRPAEQSEIPLPTATTAMASSNGELEKAVSFAEAGQDSPAALSALPTLSPNTAPIPAKKQRKLNAAALKQRFMREPIATVASFPHTSFGRKSKIQKQTTPPLSAGYADSFDGSSHVNGMVTVKGVSSKQTTDTSSSELDQEIGGLGSEESGVLKRVYDTWALTSVCFANIGPIAGAFFGVHTAKEYGGYSMLAIGWPISGIFMCLFSATLAEMASSYPVAGAMFTWTFRLCRLSPTLRPLARFLSWLAGSLLLCGHILSQMLLEYQIAIQFQGLIIMYSETYTPTLWRTIFIAWGFLLVSGVVAVMRIGKSPMLWKGISVFFFLYTLFIIISLFTANKHRNSASVLFLSYYNTSGWTPKGYVYLLGWVLTSIATGQDVAAHLAEETRSPTKAVPNAMFWSVVLSYLTGWIVMLSLMVVTPLEEAIGAPQTPHDYGAPAQLLNAVLPRPLAFVILLLMVIGMQFQDIAQLLASSRFIWALARDSAIPFSHFFRKLSPNGRLPIRATWAVCAVAAPSLMLIQIDKAIATSLILKGCGSSLVLAYAFPVVIYLTCEKGALDHDGRNQWTLRSWSKPAACIGLVYISLILVMMSCPNAKPVTAVSFSYAPPILLAVFMLSTLTWVLYGNSHYAGPIKSTLVYTIGREVDLPTSQHTPSTQRPSNKTPRKASSPLGLNGSNTNPFENNGATTTDFEIGKTAGFYSESIATANWSRAQEDGTGARSFGPDDSRATETQGTDMTGESYSGSSEEEDDDDYESDDEDDVRSQPPAQVGSAARTSTTGQEPIQRSTPSAQSR